MKIARLYDLLIFCVCSYFLLNRIILSQRLHKKMSKRFGMWQIFTCIYWRIIFTGFWWWW